MFLRIFLIFLFSVFPKTFSLVSAKKGIQCSDLTDDISVIAERKRKKEAFFGLMSGFWK